MASANSRRQEVAEAGRRKVKLIDPLAVLLNFDILELRFDVSTHANQNLNLRLFNKILFFF